MIMDIYRQSGMKRPLQFRSFVFALVMPLALLLVHGCSGANEKTGEPILIILDTDMGSDCDDAGALALLHTYADEGKVTILGCIYSSSKVPYGVGVIDAINTAYGRPGIPVGAARTGEVGDPVDKMNAEKLARDTATFGQDLVDTEDAIPLVPLGRGLLTNAPDTSVIYITIGHTKGLYDLLVSGPDRSSSLTGSELVKKKIRSWVALGALGANSPDGYYHRDWNFFFNGTAPYTDYLVDHFPRPVYFVDAGSGVMTGSSLEQTPGNHIVRRAYEEWLGNFGGRTLEDQRPSWDLATVYFAITGEGRFLRIIGPGRLDVDPDRGCRWYPDSSGTGQFLVEQVPGTDAAFATYLNDRISAGFR